MGVGIELMGGEGGIEVGWYIHHLQRTTYPGPGTYHACGVGV